MRPNKILLFISFIITGCSTQKNVVGCYRSNFAEMSFFSTHLHLNKDSTFDYRFAGDLVNEVGHGKYLLHKDTIILLMHKTKTEDVSDILSSGKLKDTIRFYFHNKKIFGVNINSGKVVKYAQGYSKRKTYLLFGTHYRLMKSYLSQHPCEIWKN